MALKRGDELDEFRELATNAATVTTTWHVGAEYIWLDHALERLWSNFARLRDEIQRAADKKSEAVPGDYQRWLGRLREHNPDATAEEIDAEARKLSEHDRKPLDRAGPFLGQLMPIYAEVAILSAALCEAHINLALAWGLTMLGRDPAFRLIEQSGTVDKWLRGPTLLFDGYELPSNSAEVETLKRVFEERNILMHPKSSISRNGAARVSAKRLHPKSVTEVFNWLPRFFSLPFDLAEFMAKQPAIDGFDFPQLSKRQSIPRAPQHMLSRTRM